MAYDYEPKVGDRVYALGQNGTFHVTEVHTNPNTVDLLLESADYPLKGIPWGVLTRLPERKTSDDSPAQPQ
jgi:hypothetical protein